MGLYSIYTTTWADITTHIYTKKFAESCIASGDSMSGSSTVQYLVDYAQAPTFVREAMGSPNSTDFSSPTTNVLRRLPLQNPDWPSFYATEWEVEPVLSPSQAALNGDCAFTFQPEICYQYAWVKLTYSSLTYNPSTLFTKEVKSGSERTSIPDYAYFYESNGKVVKDTKVEVSVANQLIQFTYYQVPYFDDSYFASLQACVNSTTYGGYAAGTLLFCPMDSSYSSGVGSGSGLYTVTFTFNWRSAEWNKVLNPAGVWDYLNTASDGSGTRPYTAVDFNAFL